MNAILWVILWSILGWLIGILAYFTAGLFTLASDDPNLRNRAARYYDKQAMKLLGRAALVERGTKYDIYSTTHDPDKNADRVTIDGESGHISNETNLLSTMHKRPFGMVAPAQEDIAVYVSPEVAELGAVEGRRREQNELRDENGDYQSTVTLSERRPLVQLKNNVRRIVDGCRSHWDVNETVKLYRQSQTGFGSASTQQYMILIMAYCAAALVMWIIQTNAGGAAPTGIGVPGLGG